MRIVTKKVYYCEFCKKHSLASGSLKKHEKSCTANPKRECRLCERTKPIPNKIVNELRKAGEILKSKKQNNDYIDGKDMGEFKDLAKQVYHQLECPVCTFSAYRLSGIYMSYFDFSLKEEMNKWWAERNEEDERDALYSSHEVF